MRLLLLLLLLLTGVMSRADQLRVVGSIEPVSMMLRELLGDAVHVQTLLQPTQNLHHLSFTSQQARLVHEADLFVWLGEAAEPAVAGLLRRRTGESVAMLDQSNMTVLHAGDDPHKAHDHGHALNPHLWLSPENMIQLAQAVAAAPVLMPLGDAWLTTQVVEFKTHLLAHQHHLRQQLASVSTRHYLSHHDPWAYFADAFGLQRPLTVSVNTEASPSTKGFVMLRNEIQRRDIHCVMAEPEGQQRLLTRLCGPECRLVSADPLGRHLVKANYRQLLSDLTQKYLLCLAKQ